MKAVVLRKPGLLEIADLPDPEPGPGELVLQIQAATTCGTDLKMFRRGHPRLPVPSPLGHEYCGVVAAVGPPLDGKAVPFREGDPIMAVHSGPCETCRYCQRGRFNLCQTIIDTMAFGAYAHQVRLPARVVKHNVFAKPSHLPFEEGALLEPLACVAFGARQLTLKPGASVLVVGAGAIGLMFVALLRALEPTLRIIVVGRRDDRRALAGRMGADVVIAPETEEVHDAIRQHTDGFGVDIAIDCTGQPSVWEDCVRIVDAGGQVLFYGGCKSGTTITLDTARVHYDQLRLLGVFHFDPAAVREAYGLLADKRIVLTPLIAERRYGLAQVPELFAQLDKGQGGIKNAVLPQQDTIA